MRGSITEYNRSTLRLAKRSEEHTSELQSQSNLVCRLLLEKKKQKENILQGGKKQKKKRKLPPTSVLPVSIHRSSLQAFADAMSCLYFFFFNDTATTEIYTLSLHDALPI